MLFRSEAEGFKRSRLSMMPHGLEAYLSPEAMADVVAFIIGNQRPPKSFQGNRPRTVKPDQTGALRLRAADAALHRLLGRRTHGRPLIVANGITRSS